MRRNAVKPEIVFCHIQLAWIIQPSEPQKSLVPTARCHLLKLLWKCRSRLRPQKLSQMTTERNFMFMRHPSCVGAKSRGNKQNWEARAGMVKTTVKTVGQIVARWLAKSLMPLPRTQLKYGGGRNQTAKENFNLLHGNYLMEPAAGIEPATFALRKHCSTAELRWQTQCLCGFREPKQVLYIPFLHP